MATSPEALKRIIQQGESVSLEFKRRLNDPVKICKSLVAFANTFGGTLILGVDDNGYIFGIQDEKFPVEEILSFAKTHCFPVVECEKELIEIDGKYICLFIVPESDVKPHEYIGDNESRTVFIRVGNRSVQATPVQLALLSKEKKKSGVTLEYGDSERLLFDFLKAYGTISFEKYLDLSGLSEAEVIDKLSSLVTLGMIKSIITENGEYFTLT